jgi:hypothetical protein
MPPLDFSALTDEEAQRFFEEFTATAPERVAALRGEVGEAALDFSPESLVPLWEWFVRREGSRRDRGGELPAWYLADPPELAAQRLSPATLRDVDAIGRYLGEVLLRNVEGAAWGIGKLPKRMKYVYQNRPVVKLGDSDVEPVSIAYSLAVRVVLMDTGREPATLLETYRANLA